MHTFTTRLFGKPLTLSSLCILYGLTGYSFAQDVLVQSQTLLAESSVISSPIIESGLSFDDQTEQWSVHGQTTYVVQNKNNFNSAYYGTNSLLSRSEGNGTKSYTLSATAFLGARLWKGAEFYYNPEMFEGTPFGGELTGLGGFQNGELQKGAYIPPIYYHARAFIRQSFGLGGDQEQIESSANQLAGKVDKNRVVVSLGKFANLDFFDQNTYSHDGRTQFLNFAIFSMGAYGYPADPKGFTFGGVIEWYQDDWLVRVARLALPKIPNTFDLDYSLTNHYSDQIEVTRKFELGERPGAIRAILFNQRAFMATYQDALSLGQQTSTTPDLTNVRKDATTTWGYGLNFEQSITKHLGIFGRWSWNPGTTETQTLDISNSLSGGLSVNGGYWSRNQDTLGLGFAINKISATQINYLQTGGMTAFIGDGNLSYKPEQIFECYYSAKVFKNLFLTLDYQRIANPAYNAVRGPINFYGLRAHIEI